MSFKGILACLVVATLLLAACGDSDADAALATEFTADDSDGDPSPFPLDEATCAAKRIISRLGASRLAELGVTPAEVGEIEDIDFTDGEIDEIVDSFGAYSDLTRLFADSLVAEETLSESDGDCLAKEFDEDDLLSVFRDQFRGDAPEDPPDDFLQAFFDVAAKCDFDLFG